MFHLFLQADLQLAVVRHKRPGWPFWRHLIHCRVAAFCFEAQRRSTLRLRTHVVFLQVPRRAGRTLSFGFRGNFLTVPFRLVCVGCEAKAGSRGNTTAGFCHFVPVKPDAILDDFMALSQRRLLSLGLGCSLHREDLGIPV